MNATQGQHAGDAVLRAVAHRLRESVREIDSVARVGGDEFAVLLEDVASLEDLRARAASLVEEAARPVQVGGATVDVVLRMAATVGPADDAGACSPPRSTCCGALSRAVRRRRRWPGPGTASA